MRNRQIDRPRIDRFRKVKKIGGIMKNLLDEMGQAAASDAGTINQRVSVAIAEKLACRRTAQQFLQARAQGGSAQRALEILAKSGAEV